MHDAYFLREDIDELIGYKTEAYDLSLTRLDLNENPYDLPESLKEKIKNALFNIRLNRYPDPHTKTLIEYISIYTDVPREKIVVGNGSDELIFYLLLAMNRKNTVVVIPIPTFPMYQILSNILNYKIIFIELSEENNFDLPEDFKLSNFKGYYKLIFLAFPNNPTGNCFSKDKIISLLKDNSNIVVIDEAYYEFSGRSFVEYLNQYKNLVILRSFSKTFSLAALRIGYLLTDNEYLIESIKKLKLPFNVNSYSQIAAEICLQNIEVINEITKKVVIERENLLLRLKEMNRIVPYSSLANFVLIKLINTPSEFVCRKLREDYQIVVRSFSNKILKNHLRVSIGKPDENKKLLEAIAKIINGNR